MCIVSTVSSVRVVGNVSFRGVNKVELRKKKMKQSAMHRLTRITLEAGVRRCENLQNFLSAENSLPNSNEVSVGNVSLCINIHIFVSVLLSLLLLIIYIAQKSITLLH